MNATIFDSLAAVRDLEAAGFERARAEVIVRVMCRITRAGCGESATKSDIANSTARLKASFARLEARIEEFGAGFSAAMDRVIFSQIAVSGALFAALKLF